jgi:thiosulfate/3-mercaptopyruvate sulfurtransferase
MSTNSHCACLKSKVFCIFIFSLLFNLPAEAIDLGLIEPDVLNRSLSSYVILDARPKSEWLAGHIPGALSFSWEDYTRTDEKGVPYRVWPEREMAKALGKMGISERAAIVVYGDADKSWGGEGWDCWVLSWLGHRGPIRLLAGGIQSWRNNRFQTVSGVEKIAPKPVQYKSRRNTQIDISTSEIEQRRSNMVLIDTRSTFERIKGRIPDSVHIEWKDFYSGGDKRPLQPDAVRKLLRDNGVDAGKEIVYYCTGGIRSAYAWLVHQLAGLPTARNYEGGFEEWSRLSRNR